MARVQAFEPNVIDPSEITGSGTPNYLAMFNSATNITDSIVHQSANATDASKTNLNIAGNFVLSPTASTSGAVTFFTYTGASNTGQTASTEIYGAYWNNGSRQWLTGDFATQREFYIKSPTYSFVASSTITNAYTFYVEAPTAGTNAAFTNTWAAGFSGDVNVIGNVYLSSLFTPLIVGGTAVGSNITYKSTTGVGTSTGAAHIFTGGTNGGTTISTLYNNGNFNIGNYASPNNQRLVTIGQDTAYMSFGSLVGATGNAAIYFNQGTPSGTNYALYGDTALTVLGSTSDVRLNVNGTIYSRYQVGTITHTTAAQSSGAVTPFTFTVVANTGQTASTEIPNFKITGASKTWAAGAITTQRWNYITANTAAFASASVIDESYGLYVEAATAGSNATITNNFALGLLAGTATIKMGNYTGSTTASAIYMNQAVPSTTNYTLYSTGSTTQLNTPSGATLYLTYAGSSVMGVTNSAHDVAFNSRVISSGATIPFTFTIGADTGQTASTEIPNFKITGNTKTWAAGAITTQRWNYITANTAAFASASTITNSYGLYVEAATAGTNATITNNYAAGFSGYVTVLADTATIKLQSLVGTTSSWALYGNQTTPSSTNPFLYGTNNDTFINAGVSAGRIYTQAGGNTLLTIGADRFISTGIAQSSGAITNFSFNAPANTGQTASTEIPNFKITGASKTWNGGNITTQRWNYLSANTAAFASPSTIADSYSLYIEKTVLGSNAAITRNWALGLNGSIQIANNTTISGLDSGGTSRDLMTWSSGDNITFSGRAGTSDIVLNPTSGGIGLYVKSNGDGGIGVASPVARWHIVKTTEQLRVGYDTNNYASFTVSSISGLNVSTSAVTSGATTAFTFSPPANTGQTASSEIPNFKITGNTKTWAAGAITTQRWNYLTANTAAFASASTITNSYGLYVEAATAGTNATITNNYAAGFSGAVEVNGSFITNIGTGKMSILAFSGSQVAMYMNNTTAAGATNYAVLTSNSTAIFNGRTNMSLAAGGTSYFALNPTANTVMWNLSNTNKTGNTASTELPFFKVVGASITWDNGGGATTITTQRWNWFTGNTAITSGGGTLTITDSYGLYAEAATPSGVTITNNYAAGFNGDVNIIGVPHVSGVAGVDGTFTSADAKTITVTKGIITSIV